MIIRKEQQLVRTAFTLMEMLVVVAIIVILAGAGGYLYMQRLDEAKINTAKANLQHLTQACETYKMKYDVYPQSLDLLAYPQDDGGDPFIETKLIENPPYGNPWGYDPTGPSHSGLKPDIWFIDHKGRTHMNQ